MNAALDPWRDARALAQRLDRPGAELVVVVGAEAWCEKCRRLRPHFDARAAQAQAHQLWLWLDVDLHAEFIDPYLPSDLPTLVRYRHGRAVSVGAIAPTRAALDAALDDDHADLQQVQDPGILARLIVDDWAP